VERVWRYGEARGYWRKGTEGCPAWSSENFVSGNFFSILVLHPVLGRWVLRCRSTSPAGLSPFGRQALKAFSPSISGTPRRPEAQAATTSLIRGALPW
jgi:hypothetical protein